MGLAPLGHTHGGISRELALVATFPQLEYPRREPAPWVRVTGPLLWERPFEEVELPPGDDPLVLVAPSTSQDPRQRMLRAALEGLAGEPVRVLATTNRRPPERSFAVPANARVVDWLSYARTMPRCAAVVCHAGHGTVARALASGVPGGGLPGRGRHGRERRARGLGGLRSLAAAAAGHTRAGSGWRCASCWPSRATRSGPASCGDWARSATTVARWRREAVEGLAAGRRLTVLASCGGGTRTHNHTLNRRALCRLSYPGPPIGVQETLGSYGRDRSPPPRDN